MPLSPPWQWATQTTPSDGDTVWVKRIGGPEKPFKVLYNEASDTVTTTDLPHNFSIYWFMISRWRPL